MHRAALALLAVVLVAPSAMASSSDEAIDRAATWLAAFPSEHLRFDAAVMLHGIRATVDSPALREAWERARAVADRDDDHPLRRFWVPELTTPASVTRGWTIPRRGEKRASTERLLIEAAHCDRNGLRRAAVRYACSSMRDGGGFYTTHALWGLVLARAGRCEDPDKLRRCIAHLGSELRTAQPTDVPTERTLDVDLFGERTLMSCLAEPSRRVEHDLDGLLRAQRPDGSWGVPNPDDPPYFRYHATAIATWALAACP